MGCDSPWCKRARKESKSFADRGRATTGDASRLKLNKRGWAVRAMGDGSVFLGLLSNTYDEIIAGGLWKSGERSNGWYVPSVPVVPQPFEAQSKRVRHPKSSCTLRVLHPPPFIRRLRIVQTNRRNP